MSSSSSLMYQRTCLWKNGTCSLSSLIVSLHSPKGVYLCKLSSSTKPLHAFAGASWAARESCVVAAILVVLHDDHAPSADQIRLIPAVRTPRAHHQFCHCLAIFHFKPNGIIVYASHSSTKWWASPMPLLCRPLAVRTVRCTIVLFYWGFEIDARPILALGRFPPAFITDGPGACAFVVVCFVIPQRLCLVLSPFARWLNWYAHSSVHLISGLLFLFFHLAYVGKEKHTHVFPGVTRVFCGKACGWPRGCCDLENRVVAGCVTRPNHIPQNMPCLSLAEFFCSRQLFAVCFVELPPHTVQRLVQKYHTFAVLQDCVGCRRYSQPSSTIFQSERDDIVTQMSTKQASASWRNIFREAIESLIRWSSSVASVYCCWCLCQTTADSHTVRELETRTAWQHFSSSSLWSVVFEGASLHANSDLLGGHILQSPCLLFPCLEVEA